MASENQSWQQHHSWPIDRRQSPQTRPRSDLSDARYYGRLTNELIRLARLASFGSLSVYIDLTVATLGQMVIDARVCAARQNLCVIDLTGWGRWWWVGKSPYLLAVDEPRDNRLWLRFAEGTGESQLVARFEIVGRMTDHQWPITGDI